jgi:hypothetical protein
MATYIGPAQVEEGATLKILANPHTGGDRYCKIRAGVDAARLKELAAQNLLLLFYGLMLYEAEDRPHVMLWLKSQNLLTEGLIYRGPHRLENGDVRLDFVDGGGHVRGAANFSALLSDIILAEVSDHRPPDYLVARVHDACEEGEAEGNDGDDPATEAASDFAAGRVAKRNGPDPYLRNPDTGRFMLADTHDAFFYYAGGSVMPEPFTVGPSGVISTAAAAAEVES